MNGIRPATLLLLIILGGCSATSMNQVDADNNTRQRLLVLAEKGDAQAQYDLGASYCCGTGFYDTDEAIKWWCRAARQGHAAALGKLRKHLPSKDDINRCDNDRIPVES